MAKESTLSLHPPTKQALDPDTRFTDGGEPPWRFKKASAQDFWRWSFSDLRQNTTRGHLAEYIVSLALGLKPSVRDTWGDTDVLVPAGTIGRRRVRQFRVQVKSAGYVQAWPQHELSTIRFGSLRKRPFAWTQEDRIALKASKRAKADVFVFAVETATRHKDYDPFDLSQWGFYVASGYEIDQGSFSLQAIAKRWPETNYRSLRMLVRDAARP